MGSRAYTNLAWSERPTDGSAAFGHCSSKHEAESGGRYKHHVVLLKTKKVRDISEAKRDDGTLLQAPKPTREDG